MNTGLAQARARKAQNKEKAQRKNLLAQVHIAKKDLCILDGDYRDILSREFGRESAADLNNVELKYLVAYFREHGWQPKGRPDQAQALRKRARTIAGKLDDGEQRLKGLCKRICRVDRLEWCKDVNRLKSLVAALGRISREADSQAQ